MCISPHSGVKGLEKLIWLKYYNERQIKFNLELNDDKNTNKKKKGLSKNCPKFHSYQKLNGCICLSHPGVEQGASNSYSNRTFN